MRGLWFKMNDEGRRKRGGGNGGNNGDERAEHITKADAKLSHG